MTTHVMVTGGTGFVGRQVVRALQERRVHLRLIVRDEVSCEHEQVVTRDLFAESVDWWREACRGVDTVAHLAWYAEPGLYLQSPLNLACLAGTLSLARGAAEAGVRRIVGVGTCFEYDLKEGVLAADTPLKPLTVYAATKAAAFLALSQWLPLVNLEFAWCRLFYLYGEGEDERRLVPYIRSRLAIGESADLTDGSQVRDFLDVADAGRRVADVVLGTDLGPINVCSGVGITVRDLALRVADEYGRRDLLRFGARPANLVDPRVVIGVPGGRVSKS